MFLANLRLRTRLLIFFLVVGLIPLMILAYSSSSSSAKALLRKSFDSLVGFRDIKKEQILNEFDTFMKQSITMAESTMIIDAMKEFEDAEQTIRDAYTPEQIEEYKNELFTFYEKDFSDRFAELNSGRRPKNLKQAFATMDDQSIILQYQYIKANRSKLGEKDGLDRADDEIEYNKVHEKYHSAIRHFLKEFEYYDIFLVNKEDGHIIYSVYKELDFATTLMDGPYKDTHFADLFRKLKNAKKGTVEITDIKEYFPSYEYPAAFVGSPLYDKEEQVGVLIMQIPVGKIDKIMTNDNRWKELGFGDSGETYLVGQDNLLRSNSRFLVEDPSGYFKLMEDVGMDKGTMEDIEAKETAVIHQKVSTDGIDDALSGKTDARIFKDYRGVDVLSAYTLVDIHGLKWALMAEMDKEEVYRPISALQRNAIIFFIIAAALIVFIALAVAGSISKPIRRIVDGLRDGAEQTSGAAGQVSDSSQQISQGATEQAASLEETSSSLDEMNSMITQNADNAQQANSLAVQARSDAEAGNQAMSEMSGAMNEINQSSDDIAKIIKTIEEIAFQTNLLALNAAVEAARAGEHGKGFAVVADEVRNLAQRAASAAKDTATLIESNVGKTKQGVEIVSKVGDFLGNIEVGSKKVADIIAEIAQAGREQADGIRQVTNAINQMDQVTQQNASAAEEGAAASEELASQAKSVKAMVEDLNQLIQGKSAYVLQRPVVSNYQQNSQRLVRPQLETKAPAAPGPQLNAPDEIESSDFMDF